jgi:hypothetical protein
VRGWSGGEKRNRIICEIFRADGIQNALWSKRNDYNSLVMLKQMGRKKRLEFRLTGITPTS